MIDLNLKGRTLLSKVSSMYLLKINLVLRAGRVCVEAGVSPLTAGAGTPDQSPQFHTPPILAIAAIHDAGSGDQVNVALTL